MKDAGRTDPDPIFPSRMRRLDDAYVRFDAEWQAGRRPRIEDYLDGLSEADRTRLLRDLLAVELEFRRGRGEGPTPEDYETRFPGQSSVIVEVFDRTASWMPAQTLSHGSVSLPEKFGRYRVLSRLGGGGMGAVYLAHDSKLDRHVAMKVPLFTDADGPPVAERFLREARAAAALHHPNLCPIHDVGQIEGIFFLTMAHIEGRSLSDHLRDGRPIEFRKAAILVRSLALAMAEAHRAGVIHRDLKPSNIMITRRGVPVIIDFGLARRTGRNDVRLTASGAALGTPAYMPPEQLKGLRADVGPCSDIYSLGVVLYELLAGQLPFLGPPPVVMAQILGAIPLPPKDLRPNLDPGLEAVCLKAMASEIEDRYASMADLAKALEPFARGRSKASPSEPEGRSESEAVETRSRQSARRWFPWVAFLTIAAGGAVLAFLVPRIAPRTPPGDSRIEKKDQLAVPSAPPTPFPIPEASPSGEQKPAVELVRPDRLAQEDEALSRLTAEIDHLTERIRVDREDVVALNERGNKYFDRGLIAREKGLTGRSDPDYDRSIADHTEVIRLAPLEPRAYFNRGSTLLKQGHFTRAIADFTEAIGLDRTDAAVFLNRELAYHRSGLYD